MRDTYRYWVPAFAAMRRDRGFEGCEKRDEQRWVCAPIGGKWCQLKRSKMLGGMEWINSAGGPLICAEEGLAAQWLGITGLSTPDALSGNDYERACRTQEYIETLAGDDGQVLVLGDEPFQSSFFRTGNGEIAIVRWVYAQSHEAVEMHIAAMPTEGLAPVVAPIPFEARHGALVLFDSAQRGDDLSVLRLKAHLRPGSYRVTTEQVLVEKKAHLLVHRFTARV